MIAKASCVGISGCLSMFGIRAVLCAHDLGARITLASMRTDRVEIGVLDVVQTNDGADDVAQRRRRSARVRAVEAVSTASDWQDPG